MDDLKKIIIFLVFFTIGVLLLIIVDKNKIYKEDITFMKKHIEDYRKSVNRLAEKNRILREELENCREQLHNATRQNGFLKAVIEADRHKKNRGA